MYLDHFQLKSQPFAEHASAAALWNDVRMAEGLARLNYLVAQGELGLVTGPSGVGKSALVKRFLHELRPQQCEAVYCHLAHLPGSALLKLVATQLGETPKRTKDRLFEQILDRARRAEGALLLLVDEAHLLSAESLVDLRLLVSSALDVGPPLKILLVGQELLKTALRRSHLADLANRISVRFQLRPLAKDQTARYVDFQIATAGGDPKIFDDSVKGLLHDFTGGVPRAVNNVAVVCLLHAAARNLLRIDDALFQEAINEFQLP